MGHLLSNSTPALDRYKWRHKNIVKFLFTEFLARRLDGVEIYVDLEGHSINKVTIPPDMAMTGQKPDLVKQNRKSDPPEVRLVELTVPWDTTANIDGAL